MSDSIDTILLSDTKDKRFSANWNNIHIYFQKVKIIKNDMLCDELVFYQRDTIIARIGVSKETKYTFANNLKFTEFLPVFNR